MSIAAVQPAAKRSTYHSPAAVVCRKILELLRRFIDPPLYLSWMLLTQVYCGGSLARRCSRPQNTRAIAAGIWNATIDLMYSGRSKKRRNRRHIAAVFAPTAIAQFSCSVTLPSLNWRGGLYYYVMLAGLSFFSFLFGKKFSTTTLYATTLLPLWCTNL